MLPIGNIKDQVAIITVSNSRHVSERKNKTLIIVISNIPLSNWGCEKKKKARPIMPFRACLALNNVALRG